MGALLFLAVVLAAEPLPKAHLGKLSTPDLLQTDSKAGFPGGGKMFCAPVAVSNGLMWLAANGYPALAPVAKDPQAAQHALVLALAEPRFLNQDLGEGTGAGDLLRGVASWVKQAGYTYKRVEFQGWRKHGPSYSTGVAVPQLDWVKRALLGPSAVWLNVGWYKHTKEGYARVSGHWVTLVGYDGDVLIVHDPSPRSEQGGVQNRVTIREIAGGQLTGKKAELPLGATGYFAITGGLPVKNGAHVGIIDGVAVLEMEQAAR